MTHNIRPYMNFIFQHSSLPSVHLFVSSTDRLVAAHCPFKEESTYCAFSIPHNPWAIKWDAGHFLITLLEGAQSGFLVRMLSKIWKDNAKELTVVLPLSDYVRHELVLNDRLARTPYRFCAQEVTYVALLLSGKLSGVVPVGQFIDIDESEIDRVNDTPFVAAFPPSERSGFTVQLGFALDVTNRTGRQWWDHWKSDGLANAKCLTERQRFEFPSRLQHLAEVKDEKQPRTPGLLRFLQAPPLPGKLLDERSVRLREEVIEPNKHLFEVSTRFNIKRLEELCSTLPNEAHWRSYIRAFREGGTPWVGSFPNDSEEGVRPPNAKMSSAEWKFVLAQRDEQVKEGHWSEGFAAPLPYMRTSPLAVAPKPGKSRYRLIQNSSAPFGDSFNDQISSIDANLKLDSANDLVRRMRFHHARNEKMALWVVDITAYFRHFPLEPVIALRNCVAIEENGLTTYHVDRRASFGGRSYPRLCSDFGDVLVALIFFAHGITDLLHYIDDYIGLCKWVNGKYPDSMQKLLDLFEELNIPWSKPQFGDTVHPLGLTVTYSTGVLRLQLDKIVKYVSAIRFLLQSPDGKVLFKDLEKLRGQLTWALCVVPRGKIRNRAIHSMLFKWSVGMRRGKMRLTLSRDARQALEWWDTALCALPGRHIYEEYHWGLAGADCLYFTDASSSKGLGMYETSSQTGYHHKFAEGDLPWDNAQESPAHINVLELLAIVCAVWVERSLRSGPFRMVVMSDSWVACCCCAKMDAKTVAAGRLLRILAEVMETGVDVRVLHVEGERNPADGLSRGDEGIAKAFIGVPLKRLVAFVPDLTWLHGGNLFENEISDDH
jgi:hypothetical protein